MYVSCWVAGSWSRFARAPGRKSVSSNCRKTSKQFGTSRTKDSEKTRCVSVNICCCQCVFCIMLKDLIYLMLKTQRSCVLLLLSSWSYFIYFFNLDVPFGFASCHTKLLSLQHTLPSNPSSVLEVTTTHTDPLENTSVYLLFVRVCDREITFLWFGDHSQGVRVHYVLPFLAVATASGLDNLWPEAWINIDTQISVSYIPHTDTAKHTQMWYWARWLCEPFCARVF